MNAKDAKKIAEKNRRAQAGEKAAETRKLNAAHRKKLDEARKANIDSILHDIDRAARAGSRSLVYKGSEYVDENAFHTNHKAIELLEVRAKAQAKKLKRHGYKVTVTNGYWSGDNDGIPVNCTHWFELHISW
jgi:hypothetical protein